MGGGKENGETEAAKAAVGLGDHKAKGKLELPGPMAQLMGMVSQMKIDPIDRLALESMAAGMREFTFLMMRNTMKDQWKVAMDTNTPEQWRALAILLGGFKLVTQKMKVTNVVKMFEDAITECEAKAKKLEGGADVGNPKDDKGPDGEPKK